MPDPFWTSRRKQLVSLATSQAIPTIYTWPEFTRLSGLMSYGTSLVDAYRQVGVYNPQQSDLTDLLRRPAEAHPARVASWPATMAATIRQRPFTQSGHHRQ
jgi:hypothetical protein